MNRLQRVVILLFLVAVAGVAGAAERLRYVVVINGKEAGEQVVERRDDGLTKVRFIYKDNGRGPEIDEEYRLGPDGTFTEYRVKGTTTFGAPIDESYRRQGTRARWKSTSESGEKNLQGTALYMPLGGSPQTSTVALAALARRSDGQLPLLPGGVLTQKVIDEVTLESGGVSRRVQLLAQRGLGLSPSLLWATAGENPRLFGFVIPGYMVAVEEGWEGQGDLLAERQLAAEAVMTQEVAKRLREPLTGLTVVRNVRVFDSRNASLGEPSDVYVLRGRITAVLPAGSEARDVAHEIDGGGRVILPGLFDMHGHIFGGWEGLLHLGAGVTTIRDMGNANTTLQKLIDQVAAGEVLAPHIVPCGFLEGESDYSARLGFVIKDFDEAKRAIDWYAQRGYPQLKIYNSFPKEILKETVAYAHSRGMRVSGHVPVFLRAQDVVDAGFDEIQHINQVLLNFFVTPETDTRTLERFRLPAEMTAGLDFDSEPVRQFIATLAAKGVAVDPTVTTFDYIRQRAGETSKAYASIVDHMPLELQRQFRVADMNIPDDATGKRYERSYQKMVELVGRLHRAGVPVLAGTDALAGFTLHRELELYVQAGMTPAEALQTATWTAARYSQVLEDRGSIEPGKRADLVLVDGDPTKSITDLRRIALVITQESVIRPARLHQEMGIRPFVEDVIVVGKGAPAPTAAAAN